MRHLLIFTVATLLLTACHKQPERPSPVNQHPQMHYLDLGNAEVKYLQGKGFDINGDGKTDFWFHVQLVGDPLLQRDRLQFIASSTIHSNLLNDPDDHSPVLNRMDPISPIMVGYDWWEISAIVLTEKIMMIAGSYWEGAWKNAVHKYLPIQLETQGKNYQGWVELTFDMDKEKLILHRAALCTEAEKEVKAGY
ncbi:hypothetical protein [Flavisolibacter nicotianae]|uniref:hypothetical protein n=1 Tax=Flavisolibacter nicotianae TaxID=2364882 RepID=UPI000EB383A1|nr:hypothetical protein [Flavisolibacter nicotianae]